MDQVLDDTKKLLLILLHAIGQCGMREIILSKTDIS